MADVSVRDVEIDALVAPLITSGVDTLSKQIYQKVDEIMASVGERIHTKQLRVPSARRLLSLNVRALLFRTRDPTVPKLYLRGWGTQQVAIMPQITISYRPTGWPRRTTARRWVYFAALLEIPSILGQLKYTFEVFSSRRPLSVA